MRQLIALTTVAGMAASDEIFPSGTSATGTRNDMVKGQITCGENNAAILAGVAIPQENVLPRKSTALMRNSPVLQKAYYRRNADYHTRRMQKMAVLLFRHRDAFEDEDHGAAGGAHVDRLIGGV